MTNSQTNSQDLLSLINGCEVWSQTYGECVGVKGKQVIANGQVIDQLDTDKKIQVLFDELMAQEGI